MSMTETAVDLGRVREVLAMIPDDMRDDVKRHDGALLTGRTVATIHGELAATIAALARISLTLLDEIEALKAAQS